MIFGFALIYKIVVVSRYMFCEVLSRRIANFDSVSVEYFVQRVLPWEVRLDHTEKFSCNIGSHI